MNVFRFATTIEVENWMELGIEWEREKKKEKTEMSRRRHHFRWWRGGSLSLSLSCPSAEASGETPWTAKMTHEIEKREGQDAVE